MRIYKHSLAKALLAVAVATGGSCSQTAKAENVYSLIIHGASKHFNYDHTNKQPFNEVNYGLGVELENSNVLYRVVAYKDSFYKQAKYATIGYRKELLGELHSFHVGASINAGYMDGSGIKGFSAIPQLEVGYNKITTEIIYIPKINKDTANVVAVSVKYTF